MAPRKKNAIRHSPLPTAQVPLEEYYTHDYIQTTSILSPPLDPPLSPPPLSTRTNVELNLSVLQRYLPSTESILLIAPYAALYTFQPSTEEWEKSSIQGTLFVVSLKTSHFGLERFAVIILNRLGLKNFILELQPGADVDLEDEIVVVRGGVERDGMIRGFWIYEEGENTSTAGLRSEVEGLVRSCVEASRVEGVDDDSGGDLGDETYLPHEDGDYINGTHVLSTHTLTHQQQQAHPVHEPALDSNLLSPETQSQPQHDFLGPLFHKAMLNYRGS